MSPQEAVEHGLLGKFISRFSVGDTWDLFFGDYWLTAQNVIATEEKTLNQLLADNYSPAQYSVDKEHISKCVIVAANMRKEVTKVSLDEKYNLTIEFENGSNLLVPSNEEIVDWQWALNKSNSDPYMDYLVACFWEGEIQVSPDSGKIGN